MRVGIIIPGGGMPLSKVVDADIERELTSANYDVALALASAPDRIRGYEQLKVTSAGKVKAEVEEQRAALRGAGEVSSVA